MRRWTQLVGALMALGGLPQAATAKDRELDLGKAREAVLRYDGARKRFTCVGPRTPAPAPSPSIGETVGDGLCPTGWVLYYPGLSFKRGDTIFLEIVNTHYDTFLHVTAEGEALTPPTLVPVAGQAELKTISPLLPDPTKVGGALEAGSDLEKAFIQAVVHEKQEDALRLWRGFLSPIRGAVNALSPLERRIGDHRTEVRNIRARADALTSPGRDTIKEYLDLRVRFERALDVQAAIANDIKIAVTPNKELAYSTPGFHRLVQDVAFALDGPTGEVRPVLERYAADAGLSLRQRSPRTKPA